MAGASRDVVPRGWVEVGRIPFGPRTNLATQFAAVLLLGAIVALSEIALPSRGLVEVYQTTRHAALIFLGVMLATVAAHEAAHGLAMAGHGLRPTFGIGRVGWFPCAWCTSNQILSRRAFLICSLVPLLALDVLACVGLATATLSMVGYAILVTNTLGAVADVWGVMYVARFPRDSFVYEARATNVILRRW